MGIVEETESTALKARGTVAYPEANRKERSLDFLVLRTWFLKEEQVL